MSIQNNLLVLGNLPGLTFEAQYADIDAKDPKNTHDSHIHDRCEVYVNLSGDVSFMVENRIYPICPGSIIITRPFEYHHCIYHSSASHRHFCFWFTARGDEPFLQERFFARPKGQDNLLTLNGQDTAALFELCRLLLEPADPAEGYYRFFKLLHLLQKSQITPPAEGYSPIVAHTLDYITHHITEELLVQTLAKASFVSVNTLERHFKQALGVSPSTYIKKKRLAHAANLLAEGYSVNEACTACGVADYSYFIALFKKNYGITPLQYQKRYATRR